MSVFSITFDRNKAYTNQIYRNTTIDNWYLAKIYGSYVVIGTVGKNEQYIQTSALCKISYGTVLEKGYVKTCNSYYRLGSPMEDYDVEKHLSELSGK